MRIYNSFEEINTELKRLNLERQIAIEELKLTKNHIKDDFGPLNWVNTLLQVFKKYGFYFLLKKLFR